MAGLCQGEPGSGPGEKSRERHEGVDGGVGERVSGGSNADGGGEGEGDFVGERKGCGMKGSLEIGLVVFEK